MRATAPPYTLKNDFEPHDVLEFGTLENRSEPERRKRKRHRLLAGLINQAITKIDVLGKNPDHLATGLVLLAYARGLVQTVRVWPANCLDSGSQNAGTDMPNSLCQPTPIYRFPHLRIPLLRLRAKLSFILLGQAFRMRGNKKQAKS